MDETIVKYLKKPELKNPIGIEGLPGIGLVGKLAADHLLEELKGKKFCEVYSPDLPPQVVIQNDGTIKQVKNEFYYVEGKDSGRDLVLLVGDFQGMTPSGQYDITRVLLDVFEAVGVKMIYTLGGLGTGKVVKEPKVYGAATSKELVQKHEKYGIVFKGREGGGIFGASGLLLGMGTLRNIDGVCLMGETVGQIVDAKAASILLEKLTKILDIKIDMTKLEKRAEQTEKELEKIMKMQAEQMRAMEMAASKPQTDEDVGRYIR